MLVKKMLSASLLVVFAAGSSASFAETADGFFKEAFPRDSYDKGSQLPMVVWGGEVAYAVGGLFANLVAGVGSVTGTTAYDTFHSDFKAVLKAERAFTSETDRFNEISRIKQDPQNYYYSKAEKKMVLTYGAERAIEKANLEPILTQEAKDAVMVASDAKLRRSSDALLEKINSKGFKFGRFLMYGSAMAAVDAGLQFVLLISTDHLGNPSPLTAIPYAAAKALIDLASKKDSLPQGPPVIH